MVPSYATSFCTRKHFRFMFMFSISLSLLTALLLFPLLFTFLCLCTVFETISSSTDEVFSSVNPYDNVFLLGDLNVNHNDWLTYSIITEGLVNSSVIFVIFSPN